MIKKLSLIVFLFIASVSFSQEKTITKLSAAPNPFTTSTKITFNTTETGTAIFNVKNVLGKVVYKEHLKISEGKNIIPFYKEDLLPGIYIYSIQNKKNIVSKRLIIK